MIANIQSLRAFAALNVVIFHLLLYAPSYEKKSQFFSALEGWGSNGVDIFFVISGFIMIYTQQRSSRSAGAFILNRVLRIAPIYWILTLLFATFVVTLNSIDEISTLHLISSLFFLSRLSTGENPIMFVGWTLEWEMFFYFIFAIGIYTNRRVGYIIIPSIILCVLAIIDLDFLIGLEFLFGMAIGVINRHLRINATIAIIIFALGAALLLATIWLSPDWPRLFHSGIPAFAIVFGSLYIKQFDFRLLQLLGASSYSIYLTHIFSIPVAFKIERALMPTKTIPDDAVLFLVFVFCVFVGVACYVSLESPLTKALGRSFKGRLKPAQSTAATRSAGPTP